MLVLTHDRDAVGVRVFLVEEADSLREEELQRCVIARHLRDDVTTVRIDRVTRTWIEILVPCNRTNTVEVVPMQWQVKVTDVFRLVSSKTVHV